MTTTQQEEVRLDGRNSNAPWQEMTNFLGSRTAQEHAVHLLPYLKPNSRVLDVGCGLGSITIGFADLVPQGHVVGIDSNPGTTAAAQASAQKRGTPNIEFHVADAHDLSAFEAHTFDIIHAHQVLVHIPDPAKVIEQLHRLLKPHGAGLLCIRDNILFDVYPKDNVLTTAHETMLQTLAKIGSNVGGGARNQFWVHDAGFEWDKIRVEHAAWGFATLAQRRVWAGDLQHYNKGARTAEEDARIVESWRLWAETEGAKAYGLDGVVLAWT